MRGRIFVTPHALHRFLTRVAPGFDERGAMGFLLAAFETAHPVREGHSEGEVWRADSLHGRIRLVVAPAKPDEGRTLPQLVTVMAASDGLADRRQRCC